MKARVEVLRLETGRKGTWERVLTAESDDPHSLVLFYKSFVDELRSKGYICNTRSSTTKVCRARNEIVMVKLVVSPHGGQLVASF